MLLPGCCPRLCAMLPSLPKPLRGSRGPEVCPRSALYPPLTPPCASWWPSRAHAGSGATSQGPGGAEAAAGALCGGPCSVSPEGTGMVPGDLPSVQFPAGCWQPDPSSSLERLLQGGVWMPACAGALPPDPRALWWCLEGHRRSSPPRHPCSLWSLRRGRARWGTGACPSALWVGRCWPGSASSWTSLPAAGAGWPRWRRWRNASGAGRGRGDVSGWQHRGLSEVPTRPMVAAAWAEGAGLRC